MFQSLILDYRKYYPLENGVSLGGRVYSDIVLAKMLNYLRWGEYHGCYRLMDLIITHIMIV